jgi:ubiquinone/menaquinone biosynthesis C-methylase UbiE
MNDSNSKFDWDSYFSTQASWTKNLREFLSTQLGINRTSKVLEIGCGTGVILRDLSSFSGCKTLGIDFDFSRLKIAKQLSHDQILICADAMDLPFAPNSFNFVVFHYFLLWIRVPSRVLNETLRVLCQKGHTVAFAEPDYKSRIEYPAVFEKIGDMQSRSLHRQGANPNIGRKLPGFFSKAGFQDVQFGISGFQKPACIISGEKSSEWKILEKDLEIFPSWNQTKEFRILDEIASEKGERVSWVPTFYTFGRKP